MAVDLDAIRKKIALMNGTSKRFKQWKWNKQELNKEYQVRLLPWKFSEDNDEEFEPILERQFYYNIAKYGILAPSQFGKPDPIQEVIDSYIQDGDKETAKQFFPKRRYFIPVYVRGQENDEPLIWEFGKQVAEDILKLFLDEDYGDITDPVSGTDLKITFVKNKGGWTSPDISPKRKSSHALTNSSGKPFKSEDDLKKAFSELVDKIPSLEENVQLESYKEISDKFQAHLSKVLEEKGVESDDVEHHASSESGDELDDSEMMSDDESKNVDDVFAELEEMAM